MVGACRICLFLCSRLSLPVLGQMHPNTPTTGFGWEPLPPRRTSYAGARRNHNKQSYEDDQDRTPEQQSKRKQQQGGGRRKNRPGYNSYLKVELESHVTSQLHAMTVELQSNLQSALLASPLSNDASFGIKPRSLQSLHMTLFFGGEYLCELDAPDLLDWYQRILVVLNKFGFLVSSSETTLPDHDVQDSSSPDGPTPDLWFEIKDIRLFPPRRNNLVVAVLEASPAWHELHHELRATANEVKALQDTLQYSKETWTAHITLANLSQKARSGTKEQTRILERLMKSIPLDQRRLLPKSIAMGGPVPTQVPDLSWDFWFQARPGSSAK